MTLNDLKSYQRKMNAVMSPLDKLSVVLNREAVTYVMAYLKDRMKSVKQSLAAPKLSDKKKSKREYELQMLQAAYDSLSNATQVFTDTDK